MSCVAVARESRYFSGADSRSFAQCPTPQRIVFLISDGTGITAETLGHSLLTQFDGIQFKPIVIPFVDTVARAEECVARIDDARARSGARPIVFCTFVNDEIRNILRRADALLFDFFESFLGPLETELGTLYDTYRGALSRRWRTIRSIRIASRRSTSRWRTTTAWATSISPRPM